MNSNCIEEQYKSIHSRKFFVTICNHQECGFSVRTVKRIVRSLNPSYFCLVEEYSKNGGSHMHLFIQLKAPMRLKTIKEHFPCAHVDVVNCSAREIRSYIRKEDKFSELRANEMIVDGSFYETGTISG